MKKILVVYYSQAGQLENVLKNIVSPLQEDGFCVDMRAITPLKPYAFPWNFYKFFNQLPDSTFLRGCEVEPLEEIKQKYDLIILGYTVWYMAPSVPTVGFLRSKQAKELFRDTPVVTVVACRDMWILAQEKIKTLLKELGALHKDHIALTDRGKSIVSLITLPTYMLTGEKKFFSFLPPAGIHPDEIKYARRFGVRLSEALQKDEEKHSEPMLKKLAAVRVDGKLIATEKVADRSFKIWSRLIEKAGKPDSFARKVVITIYVSFLLLLICTVIPLNIIIRKIISLFQKEKIKKMEAYYELPSGR